MDMFMDKLAQKLTAQEIIKANTAADIEELNRLKNQIAEYNECLAKLQKLIDDGAAKLADARAYSDEMDSRIQGNMGRIQVRIEETSRLVKSEAGETRSRMEELDNAVKSEAGETRARMEELGNSVKSEAGETRARMEELDNAVKSEAGETRARMEELDNAVKSEAGETRVRIEEAGKLLREGIGALQSRIEEMNNLVSAEADALRKKSEEAAEVHREKNNQLKEGMNEIQAYLEETGRLVREEMNGSQARLKESMEEIQTLRHDVETLRQIQGKMVEKFDSMDKSVAWQLELMAKSVGDKLEQLGTEEEEEASGQLGERLDAVEESVHRECVKVYRNVQAVVTEEGGRQDNALTEVKGGMAYLKGRLGAVMAFSVMAMILSLAGVAFQVLVWLDILP